MWFAYTHTHTHEHTRILLSHKKRMKQCHLQQHEWIITVSKGNQRQISYDITYMWNLKYDTYGLFDKQKQTHRFRKQTKDYQRRTERGGMSQEFEITRYKLLYTTDKQQGPTVQYRELCSQSCNNLQWKGMEIRIYIYV